MDECPVGGSGDQADGLDCRLFIALRTRWHPRPLERAVIWFTLTGNNGFFWLGLAVVLWLAGAGDGLATFIATGVFVYVSLVINFGIKVLLGRDRPSPEKLGLAPLVKPPASKSFPSSHATTSFAAACVLTWYHPQLFALFFILAFLLSWSRVYVGVHYPSDVVAGTLVGIVLGAAGVLLLSLFH